LEKIEMKKTLVAVAALAAVAGAHAEATISGLLDAAITVNGTSSTLGAGPNGGSEFTLGVSEDLHGGLKAIGAFTIHANIFTAADDTTRGDGASFKSYNSFVGLSGEFGTIKLGSQWNPVFLASTISDVTGRWNSSSLANPAELQNTNSVTYTSPNISGFSFSFQRQLGTDGDYTDGYIGIANANTGGGASQAYSINYANGGFNGAYAYSTGSIGATSGETASATGIFAVSYNFGPATVHYANLITDNAVNGTNVTSNSLGISAPLGDAVLGAQWSSDSSSNTVSSYVLTYNLSKRTAIYASSNYASSTASTTNQIGIKHAF